MKNFKQFILEKNLIARGLAGLAVVAGLQAGGMMHQPVPNISTQSRTQEVSGEETRTTEMKRSGPMKAGQQARHIHRGFLDTGPSRIVVDKLSQNVPSQSSLSIVKTGPKGRSGASIKKVGPVSTRTGKISDTDLKVPSNSVTASTQSSSFRPIGKISDTDFKGLNDPK
jgi:hypothetical protein